MKKFLITILSLFITVSMAAAAEQNDKCTLYFYQNGEERKIDRNYSEIAPVVEKIFLNNFDIGLTNLLTDKTVEDMKQEGTHIEITFENPRVFKTSMSHMAYIGYKTYVVKDDGEIDTLPVTKIFLTYREGGKARGIGSAEIKPHIINVDQRKLRIITGDYNGYKGAPEFAYFVEDEYMTLLKMFEK